VVIGRGHVPADILFIGLGPGRTENNLGLPFVGDSGKLLDEAISRALAVARWRPARRPTYYLTNVVACRPCDNKPGPNRDPTPEEAWACWPRLEATYGIIKPKMVILLGQTTARLYGKVWPGTMLLEHPAYLVRQGRTKSPNFPTYCRKLADGIQKYLGEV